MIQSEKKSFGRRVGIHLRRTIVSGILILVPLGITFIIVRWVFINIDGLANPAIEKYTGYAVPGVGIVTLLIIVYILGLIWTRRLGRRVIRTIQEYLLKIPIIGAVYGPARQLIESFTGDGAAGFKRVVVVEYPKEGTWMIGFLTGISQVAPGDTMGVVYLPTAPTPNSGWVAMIPLHQIYDTTMSIQEAMQMVLSGGISSPHQIDLKDMDPQETRRLMEDGPQIGPESSVFNLPGIRRGDDEDSS